jgi:recombination protein RecT
MQTTNELAQKTSIALFQSQFHKYEKTVIDLLGTKYGISPQEFMIKALNAIKKSPDLLKCNPQSLFGSILYFAEIGLPFNTPEGFGYILPERQKGGTVEAVPIIGYKGFIEIAYRNPKVKGIRIQAVYKNDSFDYAYGTQEYLNHKPVSETARGELTHVYAIANLEGIAPLFVVVDKRELDKIKKMPSTLNQTAFSKSNDFDIFNIMEAKVAVRLLLKTLPKTGSADLVKYAELDAKFEYEKGMKIFATENGYQVVHPSKKTSALVDVELDPIVVTETDALKAKHELHDEKS